MESTYRYQDFLDAIYDDDVELVEYLIDLGLDIGIDDNHAVVYAAQNERYDILQILIDHGADLNSTIYELLEIIDRYNDQRLLDVLENNLFSPDFLLFKAIENRYLNVTNLLLDSGMNINYVLTLAIKYNYPELLLNLIERGVKLNIVHLNTAVKDNDLEIVKILIDNGVRPDQKLIDSTDDEEIKYILEYPEASIVLTKSAHKQL